MTDSNRAKGGRLGAVAIVLVVVPCGLLMSDVLPIRDDVRTARISESSLRRLAKVSPTPPYPTASIESKASGPAIAAVRVNTSGRVDRVDVLQAPDAHIKKAVATTVKQWQFAPLFVARGSSEKGRLESKLVFYFRIEDGVGHVISPSEAAGEPPTRTAFVRADGPPAAPPVVVLDAPSSEMDEQTLAKLPVEARPLVLDVRHRQAYLAGHREGSVNIPVDELPARARAELLQARKIAVDCTREAMRQCRAADGILRRQGFADVVVLVRQP